MHRHLGICGLLLGAVCLIVGCSTSGRPDAVTNEPGAPDRTYLLAEEPENAQGVEQVRQQSQNDELVAVAGRIGGSPEPFVDGIAAFTIVDPKVAWCAADEGCPTPWDYCCADTAGKLALVKIVGADGQAVTKDARRLLGVKELSQVVVRGTAKRDEQGNLTVLAEKVYLAPE